MQGATATASAAAADAARAAADEDRDARLQAATREAAAARGRLSDLTAGLAASADELRAERATAAALMLFVVNLIGYGAGPPAIGFISDTVSKRTLVSMEAPLTLNQCGTIESQLKAVRDGREVNLTDAQLQEAAATNADYCAPARKTGVRWAISIGFLFLLWAAAHFLLLGRTMQRDLWTPEEEPATA